MYFLNLKDKIVSRRVASEITEEIKTTKLEEDPELFKLNKKRHIEQAGTVPNKRRKLNPKNPKVDSRNKITNYITSEDIRCKERNYDVGVKVVEDKTSLITLDVLITNDKSILKVHDLAVYGGTGLKVTENSGELKEATEPRTENEDKSLSQSQDTASQHLSKVVDEDENEATNTVQTVAFFMETFEKYGKVVDKTIANNKILLIDQTNNNLTTQEPDLVASERTGPENMEKIGDLEKLMEQETEPEDIQGNQVQSQQATRSSNKGNIIIK